MISRDDNVTLHNVDVVDDIVDDVDEDSAESPPRFVFSHRVRRHSQCLSLCLQCLENLATDINMLLELVVSGVCEKLARIAWSFRDSAPMLKRICAVISKLSKLEQSVETLTTTKQRVLEPLIAVAKYIFVHSSFLGSTARRS